MPKNEENNSFLIYFWRGRGRKKDSFFWSRGWDGAKHFKRCLEILFWNGQGTEVNMALSCSE